MPRFQKWEKFGFEMFFKIFWQILEFWSAFYSKTAVFETNVSYIGLVRSCSYLLHQTFPEPAMHSDLMPYFVKGYLGKKYSVHMPMCAPLFPLQWQRWAGSHKNSSRSNSKIICEI